MAAKRRTTSARPKFSLKPESQDEDITIRLTKAEIADIDYYGKHAANGSSVGYVCAQIIRMTVERDITPAVAKLKADVAAANTTSITKQGKDKVA